MGYARKERAATTGRLAQALLTLGIRTSSRPLIQAAKQAYQSLFDHYDQTGWDTANRDFESKRLVYLDALLAKMP